MGIAGRIAKGFLRSKLTPLVTFASLVVGGIALIATPREEEPQISVPMIDVTIALPGAHPAEVEQLLTRPAEKLMWEIPGVEHVYSVAGDGWTMLTVRFTVGEDQDRSVNAVHTKLASVADQAPPGTLPPLVRPHTIDDVPFYALTLHSASDGPEVLRQVAAHLEEEIRTIPDVAGTTLIGGRPRQVRVVLDPARLTAAGLSASEVMGALRGANSRVPAGEFATGDRTLLVSVGAELRDAADVRGVMVGAHQGRPIYLASVAT